MPETSRQRHREGLLYGLAAYGWWGMVPLYFKLLAEVPALEVLAHRIVWSTIFLAILLQWWQRWLDFARCLGNVAVMRALAVSTVLVATNWYVYIYGVSTNQILQTSLGYFINPLVSVLLGVIFHRERLRPWQLVAVGLAALAVANLTRLAGELPWIALTLAFSFGFYGLVRKSVPVDGLIGLSVETLMVTPAAIVYLVWLHFAGASSWSTVSPTLDWLLAASGIVTAVPLLCFGQAARRLPLSMLGFLQYLAPTLQFLLAVLWFKEPLDGERLASFVGIWMALGVFSVDALWARRGVKES